MRTENGRRTSWRDMASSQEYYGLWAPNLTKKTISWSLQSRKLFLSREIVESGLHWNFLFEKSKVSEQQVKSICEIIKEQCECGVAYGEKRMFDCQQFCSSSWSEESHSSDQACSWRIRDLLSAGSLMGCDSQERRNKGFHQINRESS